MALTEGASKKGFSPGMLIYDSRYRAITIQVVVGVLFVLGLLWLVMNAQQNLAALGKSPTFDFLWDRSGLAIDQRLFDYSEESSWFAAWMIGVANTILVAIMACVSATILGVLLGVFRLSKNYVVSRIATIYVEIFRNVPLLLWLLFAVAIFTLVAPPPADFRGEDPKASILFGMFAFTNQGAYVPGLTFAHDLGGFSLGPVHFSFNILLLLAVVVAAILTIRGVNRRAKLVQEATGERPVTWWKNLAIFILPLAVLLFVLGAALSLPAMTKFRFEGGITVGTPLMALWIGLTLYLAAFIAENVRAGIMAISKGQSEAAAALGLRPGRAMSLIVLPQALRVIVPPMISQFLNITKNSSLAIATSYPDLRYSLGVASNQRGVELQAILLTMLSYLILSLLISTLGNWYNNSVRLKER